MSTLSQPASRASALTPIDASPSRTIIRPTASRMRARIASESRAEPRFATDVTIR